MPEPIATLQIQDSRQRFYVDPFDLSALFFRLEPCTRFIHDGVEYKLNMTEYNQRMARNRNIRHQDIDDYNSGAISHEEFNSRMDMYLDSVATYEVIDEYEKVCGLYDSRTKSLQMHFKQVVIDGVTYYYDVVDRSVYTYVGSSIGILADDESEIIRYDSQSDYMYLPTYVPRD